MTSGKVLKSIPWKLIEKYQQVPESWKYLQVPELWKKGNGFLVTNQLCVFTIMFIVYKHYIKHPSFDTNGKVYIYGKCLSIDAALNHQPSKSDGDLIKSFFFSMTFNTVVSIRNGCHIVHKVVLEFWFKLPLKLLECCEMLLL